MCSFFWSSSIIFPALHIKLGTPQFSFDDCFSPPRYYISFFIILYLSSQFFLTSSYNFLFCLQSQKPPGDRFFHKASAQNVFQEIAERCVCGFFCLEFFSFILAVQGKDEKFHIVNTSREGIKGGFIYSVQMKANLNRGTFVIQFRNAIQYLSSAFLFRLANTHLQCAVTEKRSPSLRN